MRTYEFLFWVDGQAVDFPGYTCATNLRIRHLVFHLFREQFGRYPTHYWHKDGFMAEAWLEMGRPRRRNGPFRSIRNPLLEITQTNLVNEFMRYACPVCSERLKLRFVRHASGHRGRAYWLCPDLCYGCDSATDDLGYLRPAYNRPPHPRRLITFPLIPSLA